MAFNWTCPHCSKIQTVTQQKQNQSRGSIGLTGQSDGELILQRTAVGCSNPDCLKSTVHVKIGTGYHNGQGYVFEEAPDVLFNQFVVPQGTAKPQGSYVPKALVEDYTEACLIAELSPKAAATLIRRCLQGMIRDFAGISKDRLIDEIKALRLSVDEGTADRAVSIESVDAIDAVRSIGNIGAHMERNINEIVEVDAGEAQALIELVEMLFEEWYGARQKRRDRLASVQTIKAGKDAAKSANKSASSGDTILASI
jgi:hypothetical protein